MTTEAGEVSQPPATKRSRRTLSLVFVLVVVLALIGMLVYGAATKSSATALSLNGKPAPDFTINTFDGGTFTLSQFIGRPVVVNIWASWCPPCREEAPTLEKIYSEYRDRGVVFVGVDVQDAENDARAFIKEFGITYPNGPDADNTISVRYGLTGLPESTFVNKQGIVVDKFIGAISEKQLRSYLDAMLK